MKYLLAALCLISLYFIPMGFAILRNKRNKLAIFALNLLTGWTFVGWVIALVWAISHRGPDKT